MPDDAEDADRWMNPAALAALWPLLVGLVEEDHVHLDKVLAAAPPPGSPNWLPAINRIVDELASRGGIWFVSLRVGFANEPPDLTAITVATAIDHAASFRPVDGTEDLYVLSEPPAIYRGGPLAQPERWEGVEHSRSRLLRPGVREVISYTKTEESVEVNEPYDVAVGWQVHTPREP
jgi:hypothetical protein